MAINRKESELSRFAQKRAEPADRYDENYPYLKDVLAKAGKFPNEFWRAITVYTDIFLPLRLKPGQTVLDVGCCIGNLGHYFKFAGIKTFGIDLNAEAIKAGRQVYGNERRNQPLQANALAIPFAPNTFDAVVSLDVLEHLPTEQSVKQVLGEIERVLKGKRMFHKITVLEDGDCMHADSSHHLKWLTRRWKEWFENQGWVTIAPTTKRILVPSITEKRVSIEAIYGYFLLERRCA